MARDDESPPSTDRALNYDIFRHALDVAEGHADRMRSRIRQAERVVHWQEREPPVIAALEESWRIQSALGALLAMDDIKAEQAGYGETKARARQAFVYLRDHLRDAEHRARGPDRELQGYVRELAEVASRMVREVAETRATIRTPAAAAGAEEGAAPGTQGAGGGEDGTGGDVTRDHGVRRAADGGAPRVRILPDQPLHGPHP
jgi:hypothetical protein